MSLRSDMLNVPRVLSPPGRDTDGDGHVHYAGIAQADLGTMCGWAAYVGNGFIPTTKSVTCKGCLAAGKWAIEATRPGRKEVFPGK